MRIMPRGLRLRSAVAFALLALVLSVTLSTVTYQLARWYLLTQREALATRQVTLNALVVKGILAAGDTAPEEALSSLRSGSAARPVLLYGDSWYAPIVELNEADISESMQHAVAGGGAYQQRIEVNGTPYLLTGVLLPGVEATYFEFVGVGEYESTLDALGTVLMAAASITTLAGAVAGWLASKRLLRPLADVAHAAQAMSEGDLSRRLDVDNDPDLQPVADSFNDMAASLEARIARELRFTADVSHELRTPLAAMGSAVSLAQRGELTGRAEFAVGVLAEQVDHFRRLTLELLEISRIDAGVAELMIEPTDVVELCRRVVTAMDNDPAVLRSNLGHDVIYPLDPVRFERVLSNLLENADRYAGGATAVTLDDSDEGLVLTVDDAGLGVPAAERIAVFGRFHRGTAEGPPDQPKGTGLGLSLVEEHTRLHGGSVEILDNPSGGARIIVRIPRTMA